MQGNETVGGIPRFRSQMKLLQRRLRQELLPMRGLSRTDLEVLSAIARAGSLAGLVDHADEKSSGETVGSIAPTPRDVADQLAMTTSNVAATLRELESGGYVVRARDQDDRRRVRLSITDRARQLIADYLIERDGWFERAVRAQLTDDEIALLLRAGDLMERVSRFESS